MAAEIRAPRLDIKGEAIEPPENRREALLLVERSSVIK